MCLSERTRALSDSRRNRDLTITRLSIVVPARGNVTYGIISMLSKDVRQQLRNARRSSTYDETSFEIAREENRSLEAKLETVNNNYRMLETSKRSIERAFAEKINYCETLEKENTILKRTKSEGGMQTPAKCAVFVREDVSGYPSTPSTPIFDTDSVIIHSTPLRNSTNTNPKSNNSMNSSPGLFRTPSLLRVVMRRNYNNQTPSDTPETTTSA